jgi:hypothetical protein
MIIFLDGVLTNLRKAALLGVPPRRAAGTNGVENGVLHYIFNLLHI